MAIKDVKEDLARKIAAVDWKAKAIFTGQVIALILIVLLHGYSTWGNFAAGSNLRFVCLVTALLALASAWQFTRWFGPGQASTFAFSLLVAPIAVSAIWYGGPDDNGFMLAGRPTGFWASMSCLGTLLVMVTWLWLREWPKVVKWLLTAPLAYCSLGFLVGVWHGASLDQVVLGTGFLKSIPFVAQPASLYLNVVLPLALLSVGLKAIIVLFSGETAHAPSWFGAALFLLLPLIMGIAIMNRYLITNLSFLVIGKPVHSGRITATFNSPWDKKDSGATDHGIEITTKGFREGAPPDYEMFASVIPASAPGHITKITLSVKDKVRNIDVLNLTAPDLVVKEDGEIQKHTLIAALDRKDVQTCIALILDHSGSMSDAIDELKEAAKLFVSRLGPGIKVEIIPFSSSVDIVGNGFTDNKKELLDLVENVHSGGGTALYDAIVYGEDELEKLPDARRVIVVFSDGADSGSRNRLNACLDRIKTSPTQVFTIGLGGDLVKSGGDKIMMQMSALSGAKYFYAEKAKDLDGVFASVLDYISCQYTVTYEKPLPPPPSIKLTQPAAGAELTGTFVVRAEVKGKASKVELQLDGIPLATFNEQRDGAFERTGENADDQSPGKHTLTAVVTDRFNRTATDRIDVTVKRKLPVVTILEPTDGATLWKDGRYRAKITGQGYKTAVLLVDEVEVAKFPATNGPDFGLPFKAADLKPGMHAFKARAVMPDGRRSEAMVTFKALLPRPTIKFVAPAAGQQLYGTVPIVTEAESGWYDVKISSVQIAADGTPVASLAAGPFSTTWNTEPIAEGAHTLTATVLNDAGQKGEAKLDVQVIKPQFRIAIKGITDGQTLRANGAGFIEVINEQPGTTVDKIELEIDGQKHPGPKGDRREFTIDIFKLTAGGHDLRATGTRSDGKTFTASVRFFTNPPRRLNVYFACRDNSGRYLPSGVVKGLPLTVKEDGKPVKDFTIESAADLPVAFGLVVDVSGSMQEQQKLEKAKAAAGIFVDLMKGNDRAFLLKFSEAAEIVQPMTNDHGRLQQQIEYLMPMTCTALYDAIQLGVETIRGVKERSALVVLTDGIDQNLAGTGPGSHRTLRDVTEAARRQDVQIFTIGLGRELRMQGSLGEKVLTSVSAQTGGSYFFAASAGELEPRFREVMRQVGAQSQLTFAPPSGANDGAWHTIEIAVPGRSDLSFVYKPGYQAK